MDKKIDFTLKNVILADDMKYMLDQASRILKSMGFISTNIHFAEDGIEAMKIAQNFKNKGQKIDIIISDWNMPGKNGLQFLDDIRNDDILKMTPFVLVTTESESDHVIAALKLKVNSYIIKPYTEEKFKDTVISVFNELEKK
jgi:two-component system, chemotaxis family, chemotaxis protein CheY